jgi:hypothetical protein
MSVTVGPTSWWVRSKEATDYYARICPRGTILPDGSAIFCGGSDCRAGGQVWIVSPSCTQVCSSWAGGQYNNCLIEGIKNISCICEWPGLCSRLISCGFNPCDWIVPNKSVLQTSYCCRQYWECSIAPYWSSTEFNSTSACVLDFSNGSLVPVPKVNTYCVRAIRCITL